MVDWGELQHGTDSAAGASDVATSPPAPVAEIGSQGPLMGYNPHHRWQPPQQITRLLIGVMATGAV